MKKYWIVFKNSFQKNLTYRVNFFTLFVAEIISLIAVIFIWLSIYKQGGQVGDYSITNLIIYFLIGKLAYMMVAAQDLGREVGRIIHLGEFANFINKPINFLSYNLAGNLSAVVNRLISFSPLLIMLIWWELNHGVAISGIFIFFISLIIGYFIYFLIFYMVGIITFFTKGYSGLNYGMFAFLTFFSGRLLPIDIMPQNFKLITDLLPFKFIIYVPVSVMTGKIIGFDIYLNLVVGLLWIIALWILSRIIFKNGVKTFESYGG